ncbi:UDP-N-acetylmuramate:L-alanyl-gamma-D-glutamyl-meso-diaminopimelate ligase [Paraferrimonas sp. SM1919]|uniref:UDP-N-acetylmuramate:L-alanyl-gamma-D-glutamyl- meso-diaminopimelate ligase n=1 Tax=Paraferrimonas sp. SM1919 TaxID=2662263 RepID=UPI0013D0C023|nr:UDP-N-acetylmuramate:L-alanyl-gamma-D-glutamyl-meso-diaminopimelate ligase [Paraferrimonas sp. SM1919]
MHIHILGICGTFMGGIAVLAKQMGYKVTGSDANVYPPMSTQLEQQGIELIQGFDPEQLNPQPDIVVIGNAMSRGNPCVEAVLNQNLNYVSGPEFLAKHILKDKWVLAVSGTHGKTTTASMLAWILEHNGYQPGFLIGGVPQNFGVSARLGESQFFVVEADEYDSAFFDKRSKFVHYRPKTLVINNLEFDHADIFKDLAAIQTQFHHLIRTVAGMGQVIYPQDVESIKQVLDMGCWSEQLMVGADSWHTKAEHPGQLSLFNQDQKQTEFTWPLLGEHNQQNALMAMMAARHVGVEAGHAGEALALFDAPKRRLELLYQANDIELYDDFAHHPTAIELTLDGVKKQRPGKRIIAIVEPRSATMKKGTHKNTLAKALQQADVVLMYQPQDISWSLEQAMANCSNQIKIFEKIEDLKNHALNLLKSGDCAIIMSNGGFGGLAQSLPKALEEINA